MTFGATGLYELLKNNGELEVIDTYDRTIPAEELADRRRRALLADLFITGTNAITETGELVNLDMIGNRVAAIVFGPRHVIVLVGRNKIVPDLDEAIFRVKNYAAPTNAMRLDKKTPCAETSYCEDCKSPDRICNAWSIVEKSFPKGRIKVVLINETPWVLVLSLAALHGFAGTCSFCLPFQDSRGDAEIAEKDLWYKSLRPLRLRVKMKLLKPPRVQPSP